MNNRRFKPPEFLKKGSQYKVPSLKPKKTVFNNHNIELNLEDVAPEIVFSEKCLQGNKMQRLNFTDFINDERITVPPYLSFGVNHLVHDLQHTISGGKFGAVHLEYENGERIREIFSEILGPQMVERYDDVIYESSVISDELQMDSKHRGLFRVFAIYGVQHMAENSQTQHWLGIFLLDPYHLVCPVSETSKNSQKTKENFQMLAQNQFKQYKDYGGTFGTIFFNEFKSIKDKFIFKNIFLDGF